MRKRVIVGKLLLIAPKSEIRWDYPGTYRHRHRRHRHHRGHQQRQLGQGRKGGIVAMGGMTDVDGHDWMTINL